MICVSQGVFDIVHGVCDMTVPVRSNDGPKLNARNISRQDHVRSGCEVRSCSDTAFFFWFLTEPKAFDWHGSWCGIYIQFSAHHGYFRYLPLLRLCI